MIAGRDCRPDDPLRAARTRIVPVAAQRRRLLRSQGWRVTPNDVVLTRQSGKIRLEARPSFAALINERREAFPLDRNNDMTMTRKELHHRVHLYYAFP